ncbi:MAG: 50S ribosomal protein L3 [Deltaproteobacteria bacterium]|nr:50S ribosomal protein L3 [Deltaproteobacteria bacterium]
MAHGLLGKKVGMTQVFDQEGNQVPVTVLEMAPNTVVQVKTAEGKDGYNAVKIGTDAVDPKLLNRPEAGVFHRAGTDALRHVREFRLSDDEVGNYNAGDKLAVDVFTPGQKVDVTGTSKGRGFAGVVKRHGFKGAKEMTHGTHEYKRHAGSIGCSAYPARVIKGKRMAGQMGVDRVTVRGLKVVAVYLEDNLLLVKGAIPGPKNGLVVAQASAKS